MKELLIATNNQGKFSEIEEALKGLPFELFSLGDLGLASFDVEEDGESFAENACKKASFFGKKSGMMTLSEDSGIIVDALAGELGVKTRRWGAGEDATDEEWLGHFMEKMKEVEPEKRGARFVSNAFLFWPAEGVEELFEADTFGYISRQVLAPVLPGLPLSSVFVPKGYEEAYAQLATEHKNMVSHRGKAMQKVRAFLGRV